MVRQWVKAQAHIRGHAARTAREDMVRTLVSETRSTEARSTQRFRRGVAVCVATQKDIQYLSIIGYDLVSRRGCATENMEPVRCPPVAEAALAASWVKTVLLSLH